MHIYVLVTTLWLTVFYWVRWKMKIGRNSSRLITMIKHLMRHATSSAIEKIGKEYKAALNKLDKKDFGIFKVSGVLGGKKLISEISRGTQKLQDLLHQTGLRINGNVLSLACGRGGWEQVYASSPLVRAVRCVTYGSGAATPGHEDFTDRPFAGRSKCSVINMDIRVYSTAVDNSFHNWLLFDGGESRSDHDVEQSKFEDLFHRGVMPKVHAGLNGFILKVLTPTSPKVLADLEEIRSITGMGNLYACSTSRQTNIELYFCSTKPLMNLEKTVRELLVNKWRKAESLAPCGNSYRLAPTGEREKLENDGNKILKPIDMTASVRKLGPPMMAPGRSFLHWVSKGVYPFGQRGSANTCRVSLAWELLRPIATVLTRFMDWSSTDTTPEGFEKVFIRKVDTAPIENSEHLTRLGEVYDGLVDYFKTRGFKLRVVGEEEIARRANKKGAAAVQDQCNSVGEYLLNPGCWKDLSWHESEIRAGRTDKAVWNTMGKREKKRGGEKGSRMIAYLPIPLRLLELKYFGNLIDLTKPDINKFGVGGVGLHDLGMLVHDSFKEAACCDDVAGFDTRVGLRILSMEFYRFIKPLAGTGWDTKVGEFLYRIYAYPNLLIPLPGEYCRSELVAGRGQRMSGAGVTYAMNTITRIAIAILQIGTMQGHVGELRSFAKRVMEGKEDFHGRCSGDDFFMSASKGIVTAYSKSWGVLNGMGFIRKDWRMDMDSRIITDMRDVSFCSHNYEKVTYLDNWTGREVVRYQPSREYGEIFGKSSIWIGGSDIEADQDAWYAMQANNLLLNYHHMRDCRRLGLMIKSILPDNLTLGVEGKALHMPRPWITSEDTITMLNKCLFGESTMFPVPGFYIRDLRSAGYMKLDHEEDYERNFKSEVMVAWRNSVPNIVWQKAIHYGGNGLAIREMERYKANL